MINLLPPQLKQEYRYARRNRSLIHWVAAFVVALVGLILITSSGLMVMNRSINSYHHSISDAKQQLNNDNSSKAEKQVSDISDNLKLMVQALSKEVLFSDLLTRLGNITPSNVILTNLSIAQDESAINITAQSSNYNAATQLQVNLADPSNQIFSKADIVSIDCATGTQVTYANYPCTDTIRAMFLPNNPFLFINSKSEGSH